MKDKVRGLLDKRIAADIEKLGTFEAASGERLAAIDDLVKLYKLRIEESKNEMECRIKRETYILEIDEKKESRFMEHDADERAKRQAIKDITKDRYIKIGITSAEIILPLVFYASWMKRGFKFEETGAFTSTTFRGLFNRFKPTTK